MQPDDRGPAPAPRLTVPGDHPPRLSGAEHEVDAVERREDRRRLEVVVPDVVRRHLVVPEQPAVRASSTSSESVYEHRARKRAAVRPLRRPAPGRRVRVARVEPSLRSTETGIPQPAAAGLERKPPRLLDRHELPPHRARLRRRARRSHLVPNGGIADGAQEDESVPHDRRDVDELLARGRQVPPPRSSPVAASSREGLRVRGAVDAGRPRRPGRSARRSARGSAAPSAAFPWCGRARRRCCEGPGRRPSRASATGVDAKTPEKLGLAVKPEPPARFEARHVFRVDRRSRRRTRVPARSPLGSGHAASSGARAPQPKTRVATTAEATATGTIRAGSRPQRALP